MISATFLNPRVLIALVAVVVIAYAALVTTVFNTHAASFNPFFKAGFKNGFPITEFFSVASRGKRASARDARSSAKQPINAVFLVNNISMRPLLLAMEVFGWVNQQYSSYYKTI